MVNMYVYVCNSFAKNRTRRRTKNSTITYDHGHDNDHDEQDEEEDDQLGDWYLMREPEICIIEIARFAITYVYVCSKDMKPIPLHSIA